MERSLNDIGIPTVDDFNSGSLLGCQYCSTTIDPKTQHRSSSQTAFLPHSILPFTQKRKQENLKIITRTMAKRILFDEDKRAVGVVVSKKGKLNYVIKAKKEVILAAGAFQSPQLLMVSGVGPVDVLDDLGIEIIADRPGVGQNLQDHVFFGPSYRVSVNTLTKLANVSPAEDIPAIWEIDEKLC
jgi:choline dehydrogenase